MSKKNESGKTDSKVRVKRWGIGKTLAVVFSAVAFVVGAAILGVYLGRGFDEETSYPREIKFDVESNQNFNSNLNRLEITTQEIDSNNSFNLTITSDTNNITARTVTLDSVSTYAYNTNSGEFASNFLGVNYEDGYVDNGILRFPRYVTIGQPFTIYLSTYRSNDTPDGSYIDQIRGGITTISATSENSDSTPQQLTIAVDTPVHATETYLVDEDGNIFQQTNGVFEVTEEEYFYVETKFYPAQSRFLFSTQPNSSETNALTEKTTFYQIDNENVSEIYDNSNTKHFYAESITEGIHITWFTATNARLQEEIENAVNQMSGNESNESIYREYILRYSAAASAESTREQVLSDSIELDIVQASVENFDVLSKGQTFNIHDQAPLRIYVGDYYEQERDKFLAAVVTSRGAELNNILKNVVLSFSFNGQDPTVGDQSYLTINGDNSNPLTIDGVNYYKANFGNPENFKTGYWDLSLKSGYTDRNIIMTVSLLLENESGEYVLFSDDNGPVQHTITLQTIEHQENPVSWTDSSNKEIVLTYNSGSSVPTPERVSLAGLTNIPSDNIYQTPKYFALFEGLDLSSAVDKAKVMFDGQVEENYAGQYSTNYGNLILVPLTITNDSLIISEVGQFNLYFATIDGFDNNNLYQIVQIVENPIRFEVSKTLYASSVTNASILYKGAEEDDFSDIAQTTYFPTSSDNFNKDQLQIQFIIAGDSVEVFREEFANGNIRLRLYSAENNVTSYFTQTSSVLNTETNQDGTLTLTYILQADSLSSVNQDNELSITQARLEFVDPENSLNNLSWAFDNLYNVNGAVIVYTPQAQIVDLKTEELGILGAYSVSQTLNAEGQIVVEINNGDITLGELTTNIATAITVSDQHGRVDTLANSWYFTSTDKALQITAGNDGISRHGFSFSGKGEANLGVSCGSVSSEKQIAFSISATGITGISYDATPDPTINELTGAGEIDSNITITKYGAAGATLTLNDIIKFYVGEDKNPENEYNQNLTFKLSPIYFVGKNATTLADLFGENGMLKINGESLSDFSETTLQNISLESISINHNFASNHEITLLVTDQSGSVSFSFVLRILSNIANLSAPTTIDNIDANVATGVEAGIDYYSNIQHQTYPNNLLTKGYIVQNNIGDYVVEDVAEKPINSVGYIDNDGAIIFYHIFNQESQTYSVTFTPEVDNPFAVSRIINFVVKRNIKVQNGAQTEVSAFETGAQAFSTFISVEQLNGGASGLNTYYELPEGQNYITINNGEFNISQNIRFDYGKTSLSQKIIVYVFGDETFEMAENNNNNYYKQEIEIQIVLPDDVWSEVASELITESGTSAEYQVFNNTNNSKSHYLVVEPGQTYKVGTYSGYSISALQRDSLTENDLSLIYNVFNVSGQVQITYSLQNAISDLLYGFDNESVYTLLRFVSAEKTIDVAVPTIVSQIGTTFVSYESQEQEYSLSNAMKSAQQLFEEGIYTEIDAGSKTNLFIDSDTLNGINRPSNITLIMREGAIVGDSLPSSLFKNFDVSTGTLSLNHLSNVYENAYLSLSYTLQNSSGANRTFNYLLKVRPDVTVSSPNYPYSTNGSAEYIKVTSSQQVINLDEMFDETTAQDGHTRFEILKGNAEIGKDLSYTDSILSVQISSHDQPFSDPAQWQGYINAYITEINGNSTLVLGYPQTSDRIELVVRRSYNGSASADDLAVVGGTIDYHFVLNDDKNYTVRVESGSIIENGIENYTWNINNWSSDQTAQVSSEPKTEKLNIFLIEGWQQGDDAYVGSTRPGQLSFNLHSSKEYIVTGNGNSFTAQVEDQTFKFEYDNVTGSFTVTYPSYLSKEYSFTSTFFTDHGELATINFVFNADAQANIKEKSFSGGSNVAWDQIFTITENGNSNNITVSQVEIKSFKNGDNDYSSFVNVGNSGLELSSVVQDLTGDLTLTATWGGSEKKSYTFTIENFTVKADLTQKTSAVINERFDTIIGGATEEIELADLFEDTNNNSEIELSANATQSVIASTTSGERLSITFNQVGAQTTITLPITIRVTPKFNPVNAQALQTATEIIVDVTFVIHPSVRIDPVYPSPDDEELDREYIESGAIFNNFENDFLNAKAVFAQESRISVEYASVVEDNISYSKIGNGSINKHITIKSITNAIVTKSDQTEPLSVNSEIGLNDNITFTRGSSGGQSIVELSISYNNFVINYTLEIRDSSLFNLSVNAASNNISADSIGSYENIYVDKTEQSELFAKNRMAKVSLSSSAAAGDYYIFLEDGTNVYQSKVINISETFVTQNQSGNPVYLDLGLINLNSLTDFVETAGATSLSNGQYRAYMFADSYYESALENISESVPSSEDILNYLKTNNSNQNVLGQMFNSFELSSRITLTYAGYDVSYDKFSSNIEYFTSSTSEEGFSLDSFGIGNPTDLGTVETGIDHFTFSYSNTGETTSIVKNFALQYRYMPDLDIQVGMSGEGKSIVLEVEQPTRIVEAFDIVRKSTGQPITLDEMVSGNANFALTDNETNQINGKRYIGISYVRYIDDTVYDIELTANGAPNNGKDVSLTLTYQVGNFEKSFNITVTVVPDYQFEINGRVVNLGDSTRFSNQDSPYVIEPNGSTSFTLAGTDAYISVTHSNDEERKELSVENFDYTMTLDETGGYNIAGNINAKLDMSQDGWTPNSQSPTCYTWDRTGKTSLQLTNVKAVEFGEQYYHIVAEDDFGYQFDLYFTLSSGNSENPSISVESGALSFTEGQQVAFGAIYEELTVQLEDGASENGGDLVITSQPKQPSLTSETQLILIQNMEAWGFDQDYYDSTVSESSNKFFGGEIGKQGDGSNYTAYGITDNKVGQSGDTIFYLYNTESQKYLKVPNFVDVTIDSISYYYQDQKVGESSAYNKKISSTNEGLTNARGTGIQGGYYGVDDSTILSLPTINSDMTWIYGTGNSVQVTMVVTLKYTTPTDTDNVEYYQMQQQISLSKTSQIAAAHQYAADNTEITLSNYITVQEKGAIIDPYSDSNSSGYKIYDDTLAVAVDGQSSTRFDLTHTPSESGTSQTVTLSAGNVSTLYENIYYSSLSGAFGKVLTKGKIVITPHDTNATFYYGNNFDGGNKTLETSTSGQTSFTKVADINYFRVEILENSTWSNYGQDITGGYDYDAVNGGFNVSAVQDGQPITISASDLSESPADFRIIYNGVYYYQQLEFNIEEIQNDYITIADHNQLSSGSRIVNQYYVIAWNDKAYRYTHQFNVTGTFASIESPTSIYTLPLNPDEKIKIGEWATGVTYTQVENGELEAGKLLTEYSGSNLYFNITSDGTSGGTGLASIDATTGAITLQEGFTDSHYVTVQIYQKVSGIDGGWAGEELSQMQLLKTIRVYPTT